jgi:cyclic pyranopterin phosphate synthase
MVDLVRALGRHIGEALDELTLTTNATQLAQHAEALAAAGVRRVNISLDTLDRARFAQIARRDALPSVLEDRRRARGRAGGEDQHRGAEGPE